LQLGVFFRSNLQGARQTLIPLRKELEHVEAYLSLVKARFPDKFTIRTAVEPALEDVLVPPFTLQPLVENAVRHAFPNRKGHISIRACRKNGQMILTTEDNGKGMPQELLDALGKQAVKSAEGTGTALFNIRKRIEEIYGKDGDFRIENVPAGGTKVVITVPLQHDKWSDEDAESLHR
jgi:two-component system sensor histidine kinase LytS